MGTLGELGIVIGLDVGKTGHHASALTANGEKINNQALPQPEPALRALFNSHLKKGNLLRVARPTQHHRHIAGSRGPRLRRHRGPAYRAWRWEKQPT